MSETTTAPEPGIYPDVPAEEYFSWDLASNSRLSRLVPPSTPAHLKVYLEQPPEPTKALKEGRVLHACVLEPEVYARDYALAEQCIALTKKGERCSRDGTWPLGSGGFICSQHLTDDSDVDTDVTIVSPADHAMATSVRDAVAAHPAAGAFLKAPDAQTELSVVWDDPATGVRCKARWDFYSEWLGGGTIMDLKGARDASPEKFPRDAFKFGYPRQAMMYLSAAKALGLPAAHYAIIAVEKTPPFALTVFRMSEETLGALMPGPGEQAYHTAANVQALLRLYDQCRRTDTYPGYPDDVQDIGLEEWMWSEMDAQTEKLNGRTAA